MIVTPETLFAALLAWDAWEHAAASAASVTRDLDATATDYRARVDAVWAEVERLNAVAMSYEGPRVSLARRPPEQRVIAQALSAARGGAEERVRAYTRDLTAPSLGAAGEDVDG